MTAGEQSIGPRWYEDAFGEFYDIVYAHRTVEAAEPEARFAAESLGLQTNDRLLDLCCGNGRHLVHLAGVCGHIFGLDYSVHLLRGARAHLGPRAELVRADMRAIPFVDAFDAVTNFFTSFGYFFSHEENHRVACGLAQALRRGGRFFLDYANAAHVRQRLQSASVRRNGPYEIRERRWIDERNNRVEKVTSLLRAGESLHEAQESVQLYSCDELAGLLSGAGLVVDSVYGDYSGVPLDDSRPRMLFIGHKD